MSTWPTRLNKWHNRGHPWHTPCCNVIDGVSQLLWQTAETTSEYMILTHWVNSAGNPILYSKQNRKVWEALSKAFLKSKNRIADYGDLDISDIGANETSLHVRSTILVCSLLVSVFLITDNPTMGGPRFLSQEPDKKWARSRRPEGPWFQKCTRNFSIYFVEYRWVPFNPNMDNRNSSLIG